MNPEHTKLPDLEVDGKQYPLYVNVRGIFLVMLEEGEEIESSTLDALKQKVHLALLKKRRQATIDIPFYFWKVDTHWKVGGIHRVRGCLRSGRIVGVHAGNDNLLVKWDDEKGTDQAGVSEQRDFLRLTSQEAKHYVYLRRTEQEGVDARVAFEGEHRFDARAEAEVLMKGAVNLV